jgi:hypothetical protein
MGRRQGGQDKKREQGNLTAGNLNFTVPGRPRHPDSTHHAQERHRVPPNDLNSASVSVFCRRICGGRGRETHLMTRMEIEVRDLLRGE